MWEALFPCLGELAARSSHKIKVRTKAQTFSKLGPELLKLFPVWEFLHYQDVSPEAANRVLLTAPAGKSPPSPPEELPSLKGSLPQ